MMIRFSRTERIAGLFVVGAMAGFVLFTIVVAIKQGWFMPRHTYKTTFVHGEGLHPGTFVLISGLRAGSVQSVTLNDDNLIEVQVSVSHEFQKRIRQDSLARVIRPFIIGDKVVEITVGAKESPMMAENSLLKSEETMDIMDLLGGGKLGPYLTTLDSLLKNLQTVAEAFTDPRRSQALIGMFDEALPFMQDLREVARQMSNQKNLKVAMKNIVELTRDVNVMLPKMVEFSEHIPELGESTTQTMKQLSQLTTEINKFLPIIAEVAPKLPEASQKSVEALKEAVIVLRAMQKSFLFRGAVKDVFEEDAQKADALAKEKEKKEKDAAREKELETTPREPASEMK